MDEIKEWLKKAKRDFEAAKVNFKEGLYDISAFLLQQAVEKILKALYIKKFKKLIKTHDLAFLSKSLKLPKKFLHPCEELSGFYIEARYPPLIVWKKYTKQNIDKYIKIAEVIIKWVEKRL